MTNDNITNGKFFKSRYPKISELYLEYLQTKNYANNPCVKSVEPFTDMAINEISELIMHKKTLEAQDCLLDYGFINEWSGFILGFSYALGLMQESKVNCFEKNSCINK